MTLTLEQQATNFETMKHIMFVGRNINVLIKELLHRAEVHDASKLEPPEVEAFTQVTKDLNGLEYGSPAYKDNLAKIKPALDHHYANNSHHPEHHARGVDDMTLVDVVELLCDWKASSTRHATGNILKSIEVNTERFNLSPQLRKILENTAKKYFE